MEEMADISPVANTPSRLLHFVEVYLSGGAVLSVDQIRVLKESRRLLKEQPPDGGIPETVKKKLVRSGLFHEKD